MTGLQGLQLQLLQKEVAWLPTSLLLKVFSNMIVEFSDNLFNSIGDDQNLILVGQDQYYPTKIQLKLESSMLQI